MQMSKTFKQVLKQIKSAEQDVDKVLDVAKLARNPIDGYRKLEMILETTIFLAVIGSMTLVTILMFTVK